MTNLTGIVLLALFGAAIVTSCQEPSTSSQQDKRMPSALALLN